ncbi:MAG: formylmethanofuran dehydrogenase subunit E family protein [Flavobacteriales bacterium]|nr:formylmethanofuran dehydrogenase subunit E family protein [Flavobacteriales bacterium]
MEHPSEHDASAAHVEPQWRVVDTEFSKGRLGHEQTVTFQDLITFHGHWCDGLVVGALGLGEALTPLFPNAPIDRTDLRIISRSSPCLTDVAVMLTGGRAQFGTFQVSDTLAGLYIVQRISDGKAYRVRLNPGIKPAAIDSLTPLAIARTLSPCGLDSLQAIEQRFGDALLAMDPKAAFTISELADFHWPEATGPVHTKTDILNKLAPRCAH